MQYGVAVSNGSVALQMAIACLNLQPGDEVIMPTFTIISCAQAITMGGGIPILVDSEPQTWCMNVDDVAEKITSRTRAMMPVHIYGHPVDMDPLLEIAKKHNLIIIEDAAEAHGGEYKGRKCGGMGDFGCFSFYANEIITTGEGGMVLTNNGEFAERLRSIRNLCFRKERRFYHTELGNNFRMTNVQAAIGLAQLERVEVVIEKKRWMSRAYHERLNDIELLQLPIERPWAKNVYWMYGIVVDEHSGFDASSFAKLLEQKGVMSRPFFLGMHEQPVFQNMGLFLDEHYPVAERIARQGLYLPSGLMISEDQIDQTCDAVRQTLRL
jgi:perosamine synthetase